MRTDSKLRDSKLRDGRMLSDLQRVLEVIYMLFVTMVTIEY